MSSTIILKNNENVTFVMNPSITYFKSVFRKHTKFTISYKEERPSSDNTDFKGNNDSINIDLNYYADLLCDISLKVLINETNSHAPNSKWSNDLPLYLIKNITLNMIGPNIEIDKLDKDYINFNAMLNNPKSNNSTYNLDDGKLTCNDGNNFQNMALCGGVINNNNADSIITDMNAIIPLPFAFSKSIGNAIPLCALNTTNTKPQIIITREDKDIIKFDTSNDTTNDNIIGLFKFSVISKYIFLSDEEKLRFKNSKQEYLYERVNILNSGSAFTQYNNNMGIININRLSTNHPIKRIYLYNEQSSTIPFNKLKYNLFINSNKLFSSFFNHEFFSKVEILNKFKGCIYNGINGSNTVVDNNIALIDFSLKNSDGPSGCISPNINNIDLNIKKDATGNKYNTKVFVVCYYFLTISNETISYMFE
jgi:hypothetical protein